MSFKEAVVKNVGGVGGGGGVDSSYIVKHLSTVPFPKNKMGSNKLKCFNILRIIPSDGPWA